MQAVGERLKTDPNFLTYTHENDTLIIQYKKPQKVIRAELEYANKKARDAEKEKKDGSSLGAYV